MKRKIQSLRFNLKKKMKRPLSKKKLFKRNKRRSLRQKSLSLYRKWYRKRKRK